MKGISFIAILFFITLYSCSSPTDNNLDIENSVQINKVSDQIQISNNADITIYFFAVEQEVAALINWAPTNDENHKVLRNNSLKINYSEILSTNGELLGNGDKVIVYYWKQVDESAPEVYNKVIVL